uniref:Cytochrome P450 n=1 Tax=Kalanchoe fedtschenkoi TaxID=63787 RepID=A0A7N0ZYV5_KALFE
MDFETRAVYVYLLLPLALGIIFIARGIKRGVSKLPPGPRGLPVIGNLHQLGAKPHQSLAKLAQRYGPIMSLELGQVTTVIISSAAAAKQVMQKQDHLFANRAVPDSLNACNHAESAVIWLSLSPRWRELRKVMNSEIFNARRMEAGVALRQQKVEELLGDVRASCELGEGVLIGEAAFKTSLNLLSTAIFSMNLDSWKARDFKRSFREVVELGGMANMVDYFPWLKRFDPQGIRARMEVPFTKMLAFLDSVIGERSALRAEQGSAYQNKDVLDTLLDISETSEEIDREVIRHLLVALFIAGTDTTSSTVEWAMTEMLKNRDTMSKAKAELERVAGRGRPVQDTDLARLPYLQAIVKETLRVHPPAPLLLPRKTLEEIDLWDYTIPKGAQISINAWAISRDAGAWEDPESFKPERFLDSDVDFRGANFELIPFGAGRRICPGLPLAYKVVHLMLGSLVNCFDWKLEGGAKAEDMDMDDKFGITLQKTQPLCAIPSAI